MAALTIFERVGDTFASWLVLLNIELLSDEFEIYILICFCPVFVKGSALLRGKAGIFHISLVPQDQSK